MDGGLLADPRLAAAALFAVGAAAGTINVIAGGGSFLTLPVMIFLGLPPTVANGTNRVAIVVQNVGAVWRFHRHGLVAWEWLLGAAIPALVGAGLGTWAAIEIGDEPFRRILAILMVAISLWTLWDPFSDRRRAVAGDRPPPFPSRGAGRIGLPVAFLAIGFYGGFVQAGVGFLILAATTTAGFDLVRGNALKVLLVLVFTPLALVLFALGAKVDWGMGAALAAGNLVGGLVGVRLTVLAGHEWLKRIVTAAVVVFAALLWIRG